VGIIDPGGKMIPWVNYLLKQVFVSYTLVGNLEISDISDRVTVQTYKTNTDVCVSVFAVRTSGEMGSQLLVLPVEPASEASIYQGGFDTEWKNDRQIVTPRWENKYYVQEAMRRSDGSPGYSMPSLTHLDKNREFTFKVSTWKSADSGKAMMKSLSCDPDSCTCEEIPLKIPSQRF